MAFGNAPAPLRSASTADRRRGSAGRTAATGWVVAAMLGAVSVGSAPAVLPAPTGPGSATGATSVSFPPVLSGTTTDLLPTAGLRSGDALAGAELRPASFTTDAPDDRARVAIATALAQLGLPYVWGGNGPTAGHAGFDCSGLTKFSYGAAGIDLPRTAHTQFYAGPHVPEGAPLQPGDLVFYGNAAKIHHVALYLGESRIVHAPTFGEPVQVAYYRWRGDDYFGATRPAARPGSLTPGVLPYVPPPVLAVPSPSGPPPRLDAPPAPLPEVLPQPGEPQPSEAESAAAAIEATDKLRNDGRQQTAAPQAGQVVQEGAPDQDQPTPAAPAPGVTLPGTPSPTTAPAGPSTSTPATPPSTSPSTSPATPPTSPTTPSNLPTTPATVSPTTTPTTTAPAAVNPAPTGAPPAPQAKPVAPAPTTTVKPKPRTSTPTTTSAAPVTPKSVGLGGGTLPVSSVGRNGRIVVRTASTALVSGSGVGSPVTVTYSDGTTKTFTVTAVRTATAAELPALLGGGKVVVVAAADGALTVLTAS